MTNKVGFFGLAAILVSVSICQGGDFIPRPPTDVQISDIHGSSLRLSWSPNPVSENVLNYIIIYRPKTSNQGYSEISGITSSTYTMRDLSPHNEYEFSVIAVNSAGRGAPSSPVVSPFLRGDPGSPPMNIQARPLSSTSVVVQWDRPKDFVGQILAYKVYYTTSSGVEISTWDTQLVGNNLLTTINDLTPRTVYAIMLQALTGHGYGPHSHPFQVKTQRGVPSQPARIVVTDISFTSVSLYWSKPSLEVDSITSYELYWNDSYTDQQYHKRLNDTDSYTINGLHPDSLYSVWIAAKSAHGEGAPTFPVQVRTEQYVPNKPRKFAVKAINTTTIVISWKHPLNKDRRGLLEGYSIYVTEVSNAKDVSSETKRYFVADENAVEYYVTDLQPSTLYSVHMAAATRRGDGHPTRGKTMRTSGGVPSRPELRVRLTNNERHFVVEISWHPPLHINGNLRSYRLIYERTDLSQNEKRVEKELDPWTERQTIHYLDYGAPYVFYLSGKNDNGWGQEAVARLTTPEEAPLAAPENLTHHLQSPTSVALTWLPPPLLYRNGEIIQYGIMLHKTLEEKTLERKTSDTRMVFSGLAEGTKYVARVRAYTATGAGPWSSRIYVTTPQYVLPAPNDIFVASASEQSVEVWWKWDPAPYLVDALGFQIMYTTDPVEDLDQWSYKTVPFTFSAELTDLEPHASYAMRLAVVTADGIGRLSETEIFKVDPTDVPTEVCAKNITTMSMTLSWGRPSRLEPVSYQISYDAYKEFYDADGKLHELSVPRYVIPLDSHITEYTLYDLMPFTSYHVNVTAIAADRQPRPPAKIIVTTAMAAPAPMVKPYIMGFGGEISVVLPKVSEEHGPISSYDLVVVPEEYSRKDPRDYLAGELEAVPLDKIGPYVSARFSYGSVPVRLPLGDGKEYGSFINRRLQHEGEYRVFARAVVDSPLKNLYASSPLSDLISWDISYPPQEILNIDYGYDIPGYESPMCKPSGAERAVITWTLRILCPAIMVLLLVS